MERALVTVIGMSIAYLASFLGMGVAWWAWRKRHGRGGRAAGNRTDTGSPTDAP